MENEVLNQVDNSIQVNEMQEQEPSTADGLEITENQQPNANEGGIQVEPTQQPKMFTQEQVNDLIRDRINRHYKSYGVETKKQLDELVGKAQSYEILKDRLGDLQVEHAELQQELAMIKGNINPDRYDDVKTYFKGKGIDFNNDGLIEALKTHPEWANQPKVEAPTTTIKAVGNNPTQEVQQSEEEMAAKLFGFNKFVKY